MESMKESLRKTAAILIISSILMLFSGCSIPGFGSGGDEKRLTEFAGTQGLSMGFMDGLPPPEVYAPEQGSRTPFKAGLNIRNLGAYDINAGYLVLGLERDYMVSKGWESDSKSIQIGAAGEKVLFSLDGRSQTNPAGDEALLISNLEALPLDPQSTKHRTSISATACYEYSTEFYDEVCIDTDIYGTSPTEKTCQVQDLNPSGGQGAPVEITKVEEKIQVSGGYVKPQFIIHVRNSGQGQVLDKGMAKEACSSAALGYEHMNTVDVEEVRFSRFKKTQGDIECYPETIRIEGGAGKTRCTLKSGLLSSSDTSTFSTPLYIDIGYDYTFTISKELTIKNMMAE